jgi:hypothetical protein
MTLSVVCQCQCPIGAGLLFRLELETLHPLKILRINRKLPRIASWDKAASFVALNIRRADLPVVPDAPYSSAYRFPGTRFVVQDDKDDMEVTGAGPSVFMKEGRV